MLSGGALEVFDVADELSHLVDKSLVASPTRTTPACATGCSRSIRQYAQERLEAAGDAADVRRRHADHYVAVAEAAGPRLRGRDQIAAAHAVERDTDNFRAALDWAVDTTSADQALRLVAPLAVQGMTIGYVALDWADTACQIPGTPEHPLFPVVASWAAWGAVSGGDFEHAAMLVGRVEAAEAVLGSRQPAACQGPATLAFFRGDSESALRHSEEWVERARRAGDAYEIGHALTMYAGAVAASDSDRAIAIAEEAIRIGRDNGLTSVLSIGLLALAAFLPDESLDNAPRALALVDEAIDVAVTIGDLQALTWSSSQKALITARLGQWRPALRASADAAEQQVHSGILTMLPTTCWAAAVSFVGLGCLEPAAILFTPMSEWIPDDRSGLAEWVQELLAATETALLDGLGEQRLATLRDRAVGLENTEIVAYLRAEADRVLADEPLS